MSHRRNISVNIEKIESRNYKNIATPDLIFALGCLGGEYNNFDKNNKVITEITFELYDRIPEPTGYRNRRKGHMIYLNSKENRHNMRINIEYDSRAINEYYRWHIVIKWGRGQVMGGNQAVATIGEFEAMRLLSKIPFTIRGADGGYRFTLKNSGRGPKKLTK